MGLLSRLLRPAPRLAPELNVRLQRLSELDERTLRVAGLVSMIAGAVLLYFVRGAG